MQTRLLERFLRYVAVPSQSDPQQTSVPTTMGQRQLAELLQGCDAHDLHLITELAKVVKKNSLDGVKKTRGRKPKNKA